MANEMMILGAPNLLGAASGGVGGGGSSNAGYGSDPNATSQEPSEVSLADSWSPEDASWVGQVDKDISTYVADAVAAISHNWPRDGRTKWRVLIEENATGFPSLEKAVEELAPTNLAASTNLAGTYTDVDETPFGVQDGNVCTGAAPGNVEMLFDFATPSLDLSAVANAQCFIVRGIPTTDQSSTVTVALYESGSLVRTIVDAVTYDNEYVVEAYWSRSELATPSGANAQLYIKLTNNAPPTYPNNINSVCWIAALDTTYTLYDSGWLDIYTTSAPAAWGTLPIEAISGEPVRNELHLIGADQVGAWRVTVSVLAPGFIANGVDPQPYIGVLVAGKAWRPPRNFAAMSLGVSDVSNKARTFGGQDAISARNRRRRATFFLPIVKRSDFAQLLERIDWRKGTVGAFLVSFFPEDDDDDLVRLTTFWCTLAVAEDPGWSISAIKVGGLAEDAVPFRFERTYSVEEKL